MLDLPLFVVSSFGASGQLTQVALANSPCIHGHEALLYVLRIGVQWVLFSQVRASRTFLPCQSFQLSKLCRFKESGLVAEDTVLTTSEADSHGMEGPAKLAGHGNLPI